MSKTLKKDSTRAIALIMFYKNKKSLIFKVLGVVVDLFIENMCVLIICVSTKGINVVVITQII